MISSLPSNHGSAIAPYAPIGRQPVGQENPELKASTFKPAEQPAASAATENRRLPDERPNDDIERDRLRREKDLISQLRKQEQQIVETLTARDREVRAHEQAHAAAAGRYGGSPTYEYIRGPNGISYAVGGSVDVDTSPIPGDPEATLQKAEQLQRAANAPADPSGADRQVAASAARLAAQARIEMQRENADRATQLQQEQAAADETQEGRKRQLEERRIEAEEARQERQERSFTEEQRQLDLRRSRAELFNEAGQRNIDIGRRLLEIGVYPGASGKGRFFSESV